MTLAESGFCDLGKDGTGRGRRSKKLRKPRSGTQGASEGETLPPRCACCTMERLFGIR